MSSMSPKMSDGSLAEIILHVLVRVAQGAFVSTLLWHGWLLFRPARLQCAQPGFEEVSRGVRRQCQGCCARKQHSTSASAVLESLDRMRLQQSMRALRVCVHCVGPLLVMYHAWQAIFASSYVLTAEILASTWFELLCYVAGLLVIYGFVDLTPRRLDIAYAMVMADELWLALIMDSEQLLVSAAGATAVRMLATGVYMDHWKALPWQIAISAAVSYRMYDSPLPYGHHVVLYEFVACALMLALCCLYRQWAASYCRVQLVVENQKAAALTLLGFQSEAVLWLDHDLRIRGPARQLAGLLMFGNVPGYLDGNAFERYIATDEDRQRFREFITASTTLTQADRPPSACYVNLRDATSTVFTVEVFHVYCVDDDDRLGHLIGIMAPDREPEQRQPRAERAAAPCMVPNRDHRPQAVATGPTPRPHASPDVPNIVGAVSAEGQDARAGGESEDDDDGRGLGFARARRAPDEGVGFDSAEAPVAHERDEAGATSDASVSFDELASFDSMSCVPLLREDSAPAPTCVVFDGSTDELVGCTEGFRSLVGPLLSGASLRDIVVNFSEFAEWANYWIDAFLPGQAGGASAPFGIKVAPPILRRREKSVLKAQAVLIHVAQNVRPSALGVERPGGGEEQQRGLLCTLELRNARRKSASGRRRGVQTVSTWPSRGRIGQSVSL